MADPKQNHASTKLTRRTVTASTTSLVLLLTSLLVKPDSQIDRLFQGQFTDKQDRFDYVKFAKAVKVNDAEEVEKAERGGRGEEA